MVDSRLQAYWHRERTARDQIRQSLPSSWRDDPRPQMDEVRETYVEGLLAMRRSQEPGGARAPLLQEI